jgi:hypothetical protein
MFRVFEHVARRHVVFVLLLLLFGLFALVLCEPFDVALGVRSAANMFLCVPNTFEHVAEYIYIYICIYIQALMNFGRFGAKGKTPAVQETARFFHLAAGDQGAENLLGHVKNTMRRTGTVGRLSKPGGAKRNIDALAAASLLRTSGYANIMKALAEYRKAGLRGELKTSPRDCFDVDKTWWMRV